MKKCHKPRGVVYLSKLPAYQDRDTLLDSKKFSWFRHQEDDEEYVRTPLFFNLYRPTLRQLRNMVWVSHLAYIQLCIWVISKVENVIAGRGRKEMCRFWLALSFEACQATSIAIRILFWKIRSKQLRCYRTPCNGKISKSSSYWIFVYTTKTSPHTMMSRQSHDHSLRFVKLKCGLYQPAKWPTLVKSCYQIDLYLGKDQIAVNMNFASNFSPLMTDD